MKNLTRFCQFILLAVIAISCNVTGADGPPGPQGPPGQDGGQVVALSYEIPNITFNQANNYQVGILFPEEELELILPSDKVLAFFLWNENPRVWRPLPQTEFNRFGTYVYNYDFTDTDVNFFMRANFDLNLLAPIETDNWTARVIIVPAQEDLLTLRTSPELDYTDYDAVMKHYGLNESNVKKLSR